MVGSHGDWTASHTPQACCVDHNGQGHPPLTARLRRAAGGAGDCYSQECTKHLPTGGVRAPFPRDPYGPVYAAKADPGQ